MSRSEIIDMRFGEDEMLKRAKEINKKHSLVRILAEKNQYLRIGGNGYTAVSLDDSMPLSGYGQSNDLAIAEGLFSNKKNKPSPPGRAVPECQLQCWMIRKALQNEDKRSLKKVLTNAMCGFDEILFALDEVSLGEGKGTKRLDMLCVGKKNNQWHPIVVELKYERKADALVKQVTEYANELENHREKLNPLLEEITGKAPINEKIEKMVIFPAPITSKLHKRVLDTNKLYKEAKIHLVEFKMSYFFHPAGGADKRIRRFS